MTPPPMVLLIAFGAFTDIIRTNQSVLFREIIADYFDN